MEPKEYTIGFRVTFEEIADAGAIQMMEELEKRASECREALADELWRDALGIPGNWAPPTRLERLRQWLGWKLWGWATRLNPEVIDG